uniref:exocyst complex component EXO70B1-like n=1 Tax=Erigeron canadensis TaxID=72917 RepID=UPI001CB9CEF4|nr:exocyst complex component EXO70B1-like [Erigeron canadensis]
MAENNGEEKLLAVARHIAKSLGHTDNTMAHDILQIFSNFDGRFKEKLHSSHMNPDQTFNMLHQRISKYLTVDQPIWSNYSSDVSLFLNSIDELTVFVRENSDSSCIERAENLLQQCMFRLEDEFKTLLEQGGGDQEDPNSDTMEENFDEFDDVPVARQVTDYDVIIDALPSGTIKDLHDIMKRMVGSGYGKECSLAYSDSRRDFINESLSRLGVIDSGNLVNDDNIVEIEKWAKAIKMAVKVFYPSERRLCDRVFGYSPTTAEAADMSFMDVCRVSVMELLNFANGIAMGSRAPDRLFKILDVYEVVKDLLPEFEVLFSDQYCLFLRNEAVSVWKRLRESIKGVFVELENLIRRDPVKSAVPGGGLHPITRYVVNYLSAACSRPILEQVFDDDSDRSVGVESSSLSTQVAWIMEVLEGNLESKSKVYRDPALSSVFMMNNGRYIAKKIKDDKMGLILGDDWIRKQKSKVRQHHVNYQRNSWHKILNTLKLDNSNLPSNVASKSLKDKLKLFNSQFEDTCRTQSTWAIFDEQLREELKISVAGTLLPAYRNFLGRFHNIQDIGKYADKHVKFTIEDVEVRIDRDLFQATAISGSSRK